MTPRSDRKQLEVPLARYSYRHEAEFAAGFLDDAGVPYRLQLDDPAMGLSVGMDATIWVRGIDEAWAREVLEHGLQPLDDEDDVSRADDDPAREAEQRAPGAVAGCTGRRPASSAVVTMPPLGVRERALLLAGSGACGAGALFLQGAASPIVGSALVVIAVVLALAGILGWVPEAARRILRAIAGHAP